jgi:hypothetical protein
MLSCLHDAIDITITGNTTGPSAIPIKVFEHVVYS